MSEQTILHKLHDNGRKTPNNPALYEKVNGSWKALNWAEYVQQVRQAGRAMISLGLDKGDIVTILGFNRVEWVVADLAAMLIGGAAAGIYTSNSAGEVQYIADHCESKLIVVENKMQYDKIKEKIDELPHLKHIVLMRGSEVPDDDMVMSWEDFLSQGDEVPESEVDARLNSLEADQLATLIYTSGTTGPPKGVMLTHDNLVFTSGESAKMINANPSDRSLSYLPLSHIAEQMFTIHAPITSGYQIYFAEDPTKDPSVIVENIKEVKPTIFFGVPRVWERFYNGLSARLGEAEGIRATLADWSRGVASEVSELRNKGQEPSGLLGLKYSIADRLVLSKVKEALGFDEARVLVSGAAPIPKQILDFMGSLDMRILEVYGQSEDCGPTTFNQPKKAKFGTVGVPFPGMEVKIAEDGEIVARGRNVFKGYFKNQEATDETLIDGWLHSGDLGEFDSEGFLNITGRKKDIIITSGGKNIAPKNIEAALTSLELVGSAVCIGDDRRFITALLTLEEEAAQRFADKHNLSVDELPNNETLRAALQKEITEKVNSEFARVEHVRNFVVLPHEFSVETGELTPTFKIKRAVVNKKYAKEIDAVYEEGQLM